MGHCFVLGRHPAFLGKREELEDEVRRHLLRGAAEMRAEQVNEQQHILATATTAQTIRAYAKATLNQLRFQKGNKAIEALVRTVCGRKERLQVTSSKRAVRVEPVPYRIPFKSDGKWRLGGHNFLLSEKY